MARRKSQAGESPPVTEVAGCLHSAAIHLLRHLRKQDIHAGIGPARLSALSVLVFGGPQMLGALAAIEQVRPPTMSRIVAGLEHEGLARRKRDPRDARIARIHATPKGRRVLERGRRRRIRDLTRRLRKFTPSERATLSQAAHLMESLARPPQHPGSILEDPSRSAP